MSALYSLTLTDVTIPLAVCLGAASGFAILILQGLFAIRAERRAERIHINALLRTRARRAA